MEISGPVTKGVLREAYGTLDVKIMKGGFIYRAVDIGGPQGQGSNLQPTSSQAVTDERKGKRWHWSLEAENVERPHLEKSCDPTDG